MPTRVLLILTIVAMGLLSASGVMAGRAANETQATTGDDLEPNDTKATATPIQFKPYPYFQGSIDPPGDVDFFRFSAQAGDYILADTQTGYYNTQLTLFGGADCSTRLAATDDLNGNAAPHIEMRLPATGDYCLRVRGYNVQIADYSQPYVLYLVKDDAYEPNGSTDSATPLTYGQTIEALSPELPSWWAEDEGFVYVDQDFFAFAAHKGDQMLATVTGYVMVDLLDTDGVSELGGLYCDSDSPPPCENDQFVQVTLPADGVYFLRVEAVEESEGGFRGADYTLTLDTGQFLSSAQAGTVDGIAFDKSDVLVHYDVADRWQLLYDLSALDVTSNLAALQVLQQHYWVESWLMTFQSPVAALGTTPYDIVQLEATTDPWFSPWWLFDGSDVGLTTSGEKIDALAIAPDGRLLLSTTGSGNVPGVGPFRDEDILAFTPTSWEWQAGTTSGLWSLYFDGSTVPGLGGEDVTGIDVGLDGDLYVTLLDNYNVAGVKCGPTCVLTIHPDGSAEVFWEGREHRFPFKLDAFDLPGSGQLLRPWQ